MRIAIVMRSKNEMPYVKAAIDALKEQSRDFTFYAIDSGSTDGTREVIQSYSDYFEEIPPESYVPGPVLNRMIEKTKQDIIVLLNADAIPKTRDWLEKLTLPIEENLADIVMCRQIPRKDARFIVQYDYKRAFDPKNIKKQICFFSAAACAFRRSCWDMYHFYDKGYSEDVEWLFVQKQSGSRFLYLPEIAVEHSHNYSLKQLYRRAFIEAAADKAIFSKKHSFFKQLYYCSREIVRDFIYTLSKGRFWLIPYHIIYRITWHIGYYNGLH